MIYRIRGKHLESRDISNILCCMLLIACAFRSGCVLRGSLNCIVQLRYFLNKWYYKNRTKDFYTFLACTVTVLNNVSRECRNYGLREVVDCSASVSCVYEWQIKLCHSYTHVKQRLGRWNFALICWMQLVSMSWYCCL